MPKVIVIGISPTLYPKQTPGIKPIPSKITTCVLKTKLNSELSLSDLKEKTHK